MSPATHMSPWVSDVGGAGTLGSARWTRSWRSTSKRGICWGHAGGLLLDVRPVRRVRHRGPADSRAAAATSLAVSSIGAFEHLETHELIEAEDVTPILEQAKGITSQLPGI